MRLEHQFSVPADIDEVWQALLDPRRVAPCMPGATLTEAEGQTFSGSVKVKLGPVSLLYKGSGEFVETDASAHKVVIKASGKDSRGNGTASATVTVTLSGGSGSTDGTVVTDLNVTGRPAQFGRGMISDVGGKILESFANCLSDKLGKAEPAPDPDPPPAAGAKTPGPPGELVDAVPTTATADETASIDLLEYAGNPLLKRLAPALGAAVGIADLIVYLIRRRS